MTSSPPERRGFPRFVSVETYDTTRNVFSTSGNTLPTRSEGYHVAMTSNSLSFATDLALDDVLSCLSNERRRYTIEILDDHGDPLSLSEMAERIATRQYDVDRETLTSSQRKCVYTGLYQAHIGKLTEVNAIEFDDRAKMLEPAANTAVLAQAIRQLRTQFATTA